MKKYKALFTDLDGTLIQSVDGIYEALKVAFASVGQIPPEKQAVIDMFGLPVELMLTTLTPVPEEDKECIERFIAEYKKQYPLHMAKTPLIKNALETIQAIDAAGIPICLITSERRQNVQYVLEGVGLAPYIRDMVARDDVVHFKPHPEALLKALKKYDMDPRDCLYVGESPYDVEAGIASGIFTVAVTSGGYSKETLLACHPDLLIEDIEELKLFF